MADAPASASAEEAIMRDLREQLKTARIPIENLSPIAKQGDEKLVESFLSDAMSDGTNPRTLQSHLYIACFWGLKDIVRKLLDAGADVNAQNKGTLWTPLHAATFHDNGPLVMLLLERGAQPDLADYEDRTPKDFASASDKVWPHFAMLKLARTSRTELVQKGIIRQGMAKDNSVDPSSRGIPMASYQTASHASRDDPSLYAAMSGDVLADERSDARAKTTTQQQPYFSAWN